MGDTSSLFAQVLQVAYSGLDHAPTGLLAATRAALDSLDMYVSARHTISPQFPFRPVKLQENLPDVLLFQDPGEAQSVSGWTSVILHGNQSVKDSDSQLNRPGLAWGVAVELLLSVTL